MRKPIFLLFILILAAATGLFLHFTQRMSDQEALYKQAFRRNYKIFDVPLPDSAHFSGEAMPLNLFWVNESLERELLVNTYWHSATLLNLKRASRWFPIIEPILKEQGIPDDFKYLAVIESGLTQAHSPSGAIGFWQFMTGTAKDYGLEINKEIDERYHIEKSTRAACRYFKKSHARFGSWTLTAAAYNAGNRAIQRFMTQQKETDFYQLLVSEETTRYIFRIVALKTLFTQPSEYGFYLRKSDLYAPIPTKKVIINQAVPSWTDFAKRHQISYKILKKFNPWLRKSDLKNRKKKTYEILIPKIEYLQQEKLLKELHDDNVLFNDTLKVNEIG